MQVLLDCFPSSVWKGSGVIIANRISEQRRILFPCSNLAHWGEDLNWEGGINRTERNGCGTQRDTEKDEMAVNE